MIQKTISILILLTISILSFGQFERYNSYEQLDSLSKIYHQKKDFDSAILAIEYALEQYPDNEEKATSTLGFLYVRGGYDSKALKNWSYGHTKGYYYGLNLYIQYKNYFKDNSEFKSIAAKDKRLGDSLDRNSHLKYYVSLPTNYETDSIYPILFIFHGNVSNIDKAKKVWTSHMLTDKFIVVYLQSYIHVDLFHYKWHYNDAKTKKEFVQIYNNITNTYSVDRNKIK